MERLWIAIALVAAASSPAWTKPTEMVVRVISLGGKFVGSSMGGAEITIRDVRTGQVLAHGRTAGGTGDTARIMKGAPRGAPIADGETAAFRASIDIDEPRLIEVEAYGPVAQPQSAMRVRAQQWVLPGRPVNRGDGWVLELPGLVVDAVDPPAHARISGQTQAITANVALMCGCPIEPGGIWDAARFDVRAAISRENGEAVADLPLSYAGQTGRFSATARFPGRGGYVVTVTAVDTLTGATGLDRTSLIVP